MINNGLAINEKFSIAVILVFASSFFVISNANADVLCKNKKTAVLTSRRSCARTETTVSAVQVSTTSRSATAGNTTATSISNADTGVVTSGSDNSTGLDVSVSHLGATGGTINNTGLNLSVIGDGGGDSTNVGLSVNTAGADHNYSAIFQGGNVGVGVSDPDESLELAGRLHLGQSSTPNSTVDKLYNVGGTLYWGGQSVAVGAQHEGTITSVSAGTGLSGGGSSGAVTLAVNAGTSANNIVQLNSGAELPAVSGVNLTNLNATNLGSGTISDSRLSGNVSLLGSTVSLGSEVSGILPATSGGTGASSLTDLIALGANTTGNYVSAVTTSGGLTGGASGSEGATLALSVDQSFTPTWTGTHSFQSLVNVGTTTASVEALHLNGRVQIEPSTAPSTTTNKLYNVGGELFFNGQNLTTTAAGGDITDVIAGTGLSGGSTSGAATLNVDVGTTNGKIVQLNGSAQLPAVSGVNLTNLNASNLASGTVPDGLLSAAVTKLGSDIALATEVSGTLLVANGGTGATTLADLIALGTNTTGAYVASVVPSTGITIGSVGTEGVTATFSIDQTFTPTWTGTHTFSGQATDITTGTNQDFSIVPNGTGKVGIGTNSPSAMLDTVFTSTSTTGAAETGVEMNFTDTGIVNSGTDTSTGVDVNVTRTGATGGTINTTGMDLGVTGSTGGTSVATGLNVLVSGADTNYAALFNGGSVGIGTTAPSAQFQTILGSSSITAGTEVGASIDVSDSGVVTTGTDQTTGLEVNVSRTLATGGTISSTGLDVSVTGDLGGAATTDVKGLAVTVSGADTNIAATFDGGSVGIGDTVSITSPNIPTGSLVVGNGALCVDNGGNNCDDGARTAGTIYANNTTVASVDLAEEFPIEFGDTVEAGDIVVIDSHKGEKCIVVDSSNKIGCAKSIEGIIPFVTRSGAPGTSSKHTLGVVSTSPGLTLGGFGQSELVRYAKVPVALTGRVPVKVSLENGRIEVGDRITPSSKAGIGMRSNTDTGVGIVGMALEPFDGSSGSDTILVLVK